VKGTVSPLESPLKRSRERKERGKSVKERVRKNKVVNQPEGSPWLPGKGSSLQLRRGRRVCADVCRAERYESNLPSLEKIHP